ncbi:sterol 3-beta-glucosyltransferase UGT80B1 isoform X2 [Phoenix dactylifera]|uniref:Sterol 3-beta-glucosyltransferase UGT80B1 isoform X2 n=1 Tax=Phoenix dactylifera TaxID=42345 RepID=A0A8B7BPV8_PHODC|nr:sterol 3-beta-glucosyltransferase UGT80B1 isoform X2 [Phoenix dactylifera]
MEESRRPRAVFMAFGTKGDVWPIAAIATAFACDQQWYHVLFITHLAHQTLGMHLEAKNITYVPVSTPPVLAAHQDGNISDSDQVSFSLHKKIIQKEHRKECLSAIERVFGDCPSTEGDFIVINFFALEGWNLAELFQVQCVIAAPYVVPYSAPSSFECQFKQKRPLLYKYFHEASANTVCWKDVMHWMWPLFTEDWGSWRSDCLNLSPILFTDPVTNLPMWHARIPSPLLLYGFSKEIVECPDYWPSNAHACGFWFLPMEWQFSCTKCREILSPNPYTCLVQKDNLCTDHADLQHFLTKTSSPCSPIFVGLSSIGSMGFIKNPHAFLMVLKVVLETTNHSFILFSAGYEPLHDAIQLICGASSKSNKSWKFTCNEGGILLFNDQLYCFSGWLFPKCAAIVHHGGSGSTAAALRAGIPQIVCPFLLDQFYWAERLCWIGVAPEPLRKHHLVPERDAAADIDQAAAALSRAIKLALCPEIKAQASKIAERIASEDGIGEALRLLKEKVVLSKQAEVTHHTL